MKALVICNDDNLIAKLTSILERNGYDCITYHWLLKALDNVEEISPHLVIINAKDYPRHWKTFVQYSSSIEKTAPKVILIIDKDFSLDEKKKAQVLGINGLFPSECSDKDFESVLQIVNPNLLKKEIKQTNYDDEKIIVSKASFIFSNPHHNNFVTGKVLSYANNNLEFLLDNVNQIKDVEVGDKFLTCSLRYNDNVKAVTAIVDSVPENISEPLKMRI